MLVVYPEHPLAEEGREGAPRRAATAAQIAASPLILMEEGTNLRTYTDGLLSAGGVREQVTLELDNIEAIEVIEARLGISLLPLLAVQAEVEAGRLVALPLADVPGARRRIVAVYRRDKYLSASLRAFVELLQSDSPPHRPDLARPHAEPDLQAPLRLAAGMIDGSFAPHLARPPGPPTSSEGGAHLWHSVGCGFHQGWDAASSKSRKTRNACACSAFICICFSIRSSSRARVVSICTCARCQRRYWTSCGRLKS